MNNTATNNAVKTFKNKNYTRRDYECTNRVACQSEQAPDSNWVECDETIIDGLTPLSTEYSGGRRVSYYGYL